MQKIRPLEELARSVIGDGKTPNLYFVTDRGVVVTVTRSAEAAYRHWRELAKRSPRVESAVEDRQAGCLASVAPDDDGSTRLIIIDDMRLD